MSFWPSVLSVKRIELVTHHGKDESTLAFLKAVGFDESSDGVLRVTAVDFQRPLT